MNGGIARPRVLPVGDAAAQQRAARGSRIAWIAGAAALMLVVTVQPLRDSDVWWHLALGRYIVTHGIPTQEPFSFLVAQHAWVGQQWLYEVVLAGLVGAGGAPLASFVLGALACAALVAAAFAVTRSTRVPGAWLAVSIVLSGLVMGQVVGVRGQVLTLLGAALVLLAIARWREGRAAHLWALPVLFLVWANLHAGFIVGLVLLAAALVLARPAAPDVRLQRRPLIYALALSVLATLVNPAGPGLYAYVAETFNNPTLTQVVTEWASPDFHNIWLRLFELQAMLLVIAWAAGGGPSRLDAVLAVGAFAATLQAQRNVSLFAMIALPQLALYGHRAWSAHVAPRLAHRVSLRPSPRLVAAGAAAVALAAAATLVPRLTPAAAASYEASAYPQAAATYVAAHLQGRRIYAPDTWGGYLAYRFPQGRVVFLYDETAIFGDAALQRYLDVHLLRADWATVLQQERITVAVVGDTSEEASALHELGWQVACQDAPASALVMTAPAQPVHSVAAPLDITLASEAC